MIKRQKTSSLTGKTASPQRRSSKGALGLTTSQAQLATFVTTEISRFDENEREYLKHMLRKEFFGAFLTACRVRKEEEGFTRAELARRMSKDKSVITRLLHGPSNIKSDTAAEFANAVEADISVLLVDRKDRNRVFTAHGVEYCDNASKMASAFQQGGGAIPAVTLNMYDNGMLPPTTSPHFWEDLVQTIKSVATKDAVP